MTFENLRLRRRGAFTRLELVVVIVVIVPFAGLIPGGPAPKAVQRAKRINCLSNLKQMGIGLQLYANENGGDYPFFNNLLGNGRVWTNFAAAGKYVTTPKLLLCPSDDGKWKGLKNKPPAEFSKEESGFANPANQENALSYFYGISASETDPNTVLSGDRNLTANQPDGPDVSPKWSYAGKVPTGGNPGISLGGQSTPPSCGWNNALHHFNGNILLGDGSVQQMTTPSLVELLAKNEDTNNFFLFPINAPGEK